MTNQTRFSIVIPTRNRPGTLPFCLSTCLNQKEFDDYNIIINDNSDDNGTKHYIEKLIQSNTTAASKISYKKNSHVVSMSENFEEAILRAEGEYVVVIGDDDGILPMALIEIDKLIKETGSSIVKWRNGLYTWPDMDFEESANYLGFCILRSFETASGRGELAKSILNLSHETLPMLYINAAISSKVIRSLKDGGGKLFRSRSPGVYSGIVISYYCGEFISTTIPFTLSGLSRSSNGLSTAFEDVNSSPRIDFKNLNDKAGLSLHSHVPDLAIYPVVDFADSFYWAKGYHFSSDDGLTLPRENLMRACVGRCDTTSQRVRERLLLEACHDDVELRRFVMNLIDNKESIVPVPRLKPLNLGADGVNLHVDTRGFGLKTIADAVQLVDKIVWPSGAPLRYDLRVG